ncbi:MAG: S9 family peptidase [Bacteroidota bacterium]|nr:S9 family peptidase [Bacteroidota bacterium]
MKRFAVLLPIFLMAAVANAQTPLDLDSYLDMESVSSPRLSPDGHEIVYTRGWIDKMNDRRASALWIMDADGSRNRFLTEGSSPRWSPSGDRIAFVAQGEPGGSQLFVLYRGVAEPPTQITRLENSPSNIAWSPDGQWLAFTALVDGDDGWNISLPGKPEGAQWTQAPRVVESLVYRRDRVGFYEAGYTHVFVVPASGGTPSQVTSGNWHHGRGGLSWTPDGEEILFSSLRVPDAEYAWRESEVYAAQVLTGDIRQLTTRRGPDGSPLVSPSGQRLVYTGYDFSDDTYIASTLYVADIDGGSVRALTGEFDRTPRGLIWAEDGSRVYFTANDRGTRNLHFASLDGEVSAVTRGRHMLSGVFVRGTRAVGVLSSPHRSNELVHVNLESGAMSTLLRVNEDVLGYVALGEVEEVNYTSTDNLPVQGWVIKPPDFDPSEKYPLILAIHGGPHGMYHVGFNFAWQFHAAKGYVVLYTNPRGSSGYGSAFGNEIKRAYPGKDYDDLMAGVNEVISRGYVDEENMFVYGCSGGGVLTSWVVGQTDRFAAASANCPVTNWLSFVGTTDGATWYYNFDHLPWENPSEHLRRSPLMYVGNVSTPTMLMTGVHDLRTPISQTEEYYQALKLRKVPTAMVRFNDEYHGTTSKPSNFLRTQLYLHHWFTRHARNTQPRM